MKRHYFIFSNGRLVRYQNTVYLHQYEGEREDGDEQSLADAALQNGCVLEDDFANDTDGVANSDTNVQQEADSRTALSGLNEEAIPNIEQSERRVAGKRPVPIEDVEAFYLFGEMDLNTKFLNFVARHRVPLHIFNYFGFYSGTFYPRAEINSGYLLVRQVEHYSQATRRMLLARQLVDGASFNILKNLRYYGASSRGRDLSGVIAAIEAFRLQTATAKDIPTLMGIEGQIRHLYYNAWPLILTPSWAEFTRRVKRPPDNPINALISFGNSLCYTLALSEIYRTPLSPLISFLHEPGERRYSLALDIAEIFKPILCDRLIFKLVNNGELRPQHFDEKLNFCYLKENGRKIFLQAWDEKLKDTIEHRNLGRKVSYRRLVRLECYRLKKHLLEIEPYEPFKIWW
jgi:CRISPR-associated protein Cas1